MKCYFRIILSILFVSGTTYSQAQPTTSYNPAEIQQAIKKLNVLGSVLYIAAHPDDENTRLITYFTNDKLYNTAYLSLTRGDGGQNLIGTELDDELGIIRTQELLEARKIDGGKQYFSRADDFGFSKHPDETFEIWNREKVLADMVWVIRKFRPDVLITRFSLEPGRTHGHHTASAILAVEAFDAAADPKRYPEQLKYVETWQPKRILWNTNSWFYADQKDFKTDSLLKVDVGAYNALLGDSYTEIAARSRSMHKSQGFGAGGTRGSTLEYLEHLKGPKASKDIFEGINTSWSRIAGGLAVNKLITDALADFNPAQPAASIPSLIYIRRAILDLQDSEWKKVKLQEVDEIIKACTGLYLEAVATNYSAIPGELVKINIEAINRSSVPVVLKKILYTPGIKDSSLSVSLNENILHTHSTRIVIPKELPYSQPYWLQEKGTIGMFTVKDQLLIGLPENPPAVEVQFIVSIADQDITYSMPLVHKKTDPVKAEIYRPFIVVPPVFINPDNRLMVFGDNATKPLGVTVKAGADMLSGKLQLLLPDGWKAEPASASVNLTGKGSEQNFQFTIYPSANSFAGDLKVIFVTGNDTLDYGLISINYDHIPAQTLFPESSVRVVKLDLKKKGNNIAYFMGAGDDIPASLTQIGYKVTILNEDQLSLEKLQAFDAVIVGIRAFNTRERLKVIHPILLKYVKNGGRLVVQYNTVPWRVTENKFVTDSIGPYPIQLSNERITKENAPVTLVDPKHPLLNTPNKITVKDFENWVQERGLYFPKEWSKEYQTIISSNDPGETPKEGGILYGKYGKGIFIYTSYSWFRQLPAGVPGAYRLFVNLISTGN